MRKNILLIIAVILVICNGWVHAQTGMKLFATYTGAWNTKVSMWTSPADQPMEHEIKMDGSMEMNGLFFTAHYHGEMMGMEYEAIGTIGYYPSKGYYESTWIDNQNANIFYYKES